MAVRSATIYYGRGKHETLFAEADDAAEAENLLTAKIENMVERLIVALHVAIGTAISCVCGLMAWVATFGENEGNRFLAVFAIMLIFLLSAPVVTMTRRANAWSHERIARHWQRVSQEQTVALRPDWTWK